MPEVPTPFLGRDILARMKTQDLIGHNHNLIMLLVETEIDWNVWADGGQLSRAQIHLKHILIRDNISLVRRQGKSYLR
jgi:hypothetical protein